MRGRVWLGALSAAALVAAVPVVPAATPSALPPAAAPPQALAPLGAAAVEVVAWPAHGIIERAPGQIIGPRPTLGATDLPTDWMRELAPQVVAARLGAQSGTGTTEVEPAEEVVAETHGGAWAYVSGAGDFDGDGRDDLLVREWDSAGEDRLRGVDGASGADLWARTLTEQELGWDSVIPDVTGDGRDDIVAIDLRGDEDVSFQEECGVSGCTTSQRWSFTWVTSVRSGADGSVTTIRSVPGRFSIESSYTNDPYAWSVEYEAVNLWAIPWLAPRADGSAQLLLTEQSSRVRIWEQESGSTVVFERSGGLEFVSDVTGTAFDGHGNITYAGAWSGLAGGAELRPAGDLTGDGVHDLLWEQHLLEPATYSCTVVDTFATGPTDVICSDPYESDDRREFTAVDASTGATVWTAIAEDVTIDPFWPISDVVATGDLNADGRSDVVLNPDWSSEHLAFDGADGSLLWRAAREEFGGLVHVGPIDAVPGDDLVYVGTVASITFTEGPDGSTSDAKVRHAVSRFSGADGAPLSLSAHETPAPDGFDDGFVFSYAPWGDLDGDSIEDPHLNAGLVDWDEETEEAQFFTTTYLPSMVEDRVLFAAEQLGLRAVYSTGDLQGDGYDDLIDARRDGIFSGETQALTALDARTLAPLWTWNGWGPDEVYDVHPDPGVELIVTEQAQAADGRSATRLHVHDGLTLSPHWSRLFE